MAAVIVVAILIAGIGVFVVTSGGDGDKDEERTSDTRSDDDDETTTTEGGDDTTTSAPDDTTTSAPDDTTTLPETTVPMGGDDPPTQQGTVAPGGEYILDVEVVQTATLTVSPDGGSWDLVIIVNGPGYVDEEIDSSFTDEEVTLEPGTYQVTVRGYQDEQSGDFTATLA